MRWVILCLSIWPVLALAQSREVQPRDLELWVEVEQTPYTPYVREMVLITIHGIYRRHITRELLVQPDLQGFNWSQLGNDTWLDTRIDGEQVKTFRRRMAIYPDRPGTLTIGAFTHQLTLTDEGDDWFDYSIKSAPVTVEVQPMPPGQDWWFPVKSLKITDNWSNAPDQLAPGEGVLRVIRIEALGATPEMIPPMPEMTSPSALIFPHPEKRFVELTPFGPVAYSFWRWTIRPGNDTSAIVEPVSFDYFDTQGRVERTATISAQRVAYGDTVPDDAATLGGPEPVKQARLPGWPFAVLGLAVFVVSLAFLLAGRQITGLQAMQRFAVFDPLARQIRRAARTGQVDTLRRAAGRMNRRDGPNPVRSALLQEMDRAIYAPNGRMDDLRAFARRFLARQS